MTFEWARSAPRHRAWCCCLGKPELPSSQTSNHLTWMTENRGRKRWGQKLVPRERTRGAGAQPRSLLTRGREEPQFAVGAGGRAERGATETRGRLPGDQACASGAPARWKRWWRGVLAGPPCRRLCLPGFPKLFQPTVYFSLGFLPSFSSPVFSLHIWILSAIICTSSWNEAKFFSPCALLQHRRSFFSPCALLQDRRSSKPAGVPLTCNFNSVS